MNGDFLNNLYLVGGLFVALTTVIWLFTAADRRAIRQLADDLKEVKGDLKEVKGDLKEAKAGLERDIRRSEKGVRRDLRRVEKGVRRDIRRLDKRLSGEIGKTNKSMRRLQLDMQVVKDRLNIGAVSRPVAPAPVASEPEGASAVSAPVASEPELESSASPDPVVGDPGDPDSVMPESGSVVPAPVASNPEADVGSGAVARRRGRAGVVPPGISATPVVAEK